MSRIVTGKLELRLALVNVGDLVAEAAETVRSTAAARNIDLVVEEEPREAWVRGDAGRLQQVMWNILSNAIKFTPPGGSVRVPISC